MKYIALTLSLALLAACNGGGGTGSSSGGATGGGSVSPPTPAPTYGYFKSGSITADQFIAALNSLENNSDANDSYVQLQADEAYRSFEAGQDQWFVIWDDKFDEFKAVSLRYIRTLAYWDHYSNDVGLADQFRDEEQWDISLGFGNYLNGDYWGDDYEVVDYDAISQIYTGRNSGFEYEDEVVSTDVSLLAAEDEQMRFIEKAARLSVAYSVGMEASLSLVGLAEKTQSMLGKNNGELTSQDEMAFALDLQKLSGVSLSDVIKATQSAQSQKEMIKKIANKIGTSTVNLETRILPELFGVEL